MTTFQAILYGAVEGLTQFLPLGSSAHRILVPFFLGWPEITGPFLGILTLGALLSVLIYFRHDWAAIVSCSLQCLLFRKKPMTLDERMPLYILLTNIPIALAWLYLREPVMQLDWTPLWVAIALGVVGLLLWVSHAFSRRSKGLFDWNWWDGLCVGLAQMFMMLPGCDRMSMGLIAAYFRKYRGEPAVKYLFLASAPTLAGLAFSNLRDLHFHTPQPMPDVSWLSFAMGGLVAFLSGLLAISGFMKHAERQSMGGFAVYRLLLAAGAITVFWLRNR